MLYDKRTRMKALDLLAKYISIQTRVIINEWDRNKFERQKNSSRPKLKLNLNIVPKQ